MCINFSAFYVSKTCQALEIGRWPRETSSPTCRPYISLRKAESEQLISNLLFIYRTVERYPGEIMVLRDHRKRQVWNNLGEGRLLRGNGICSETWKLSRLAGKRRGDEKNIQSRKKNSTWKPWGTKYEYGRRSGWHSVFL